MSAHRRPGLSDRDVTVLRLLLQFRLLTSTQLQRLVMAEGSDLTRARRMRSVLQRLADTQTIARLKRRIGGIRAGSDGTVYRLTGRGASALNRIDGTQRRRIGGEPGERYIRHVLAVSEQFVRLTEQTRVTSDELLAFDAEPRSWRAYAAPYGGMTTLKPDAFARTASGAYEHASFIEIDLATESLTTLARKCRGYVAYWRTGHEQQHLGIFPRVVWVVPDERRTTQVRRVIAKLPRDTHALFTVCTPDHATAVLLGHAIEVDEGLRP